MDTSNISAYWHLSVEVNCPNCGTEWDLMNTEVDLFYDSDSIQACETNTERTKNIPVTCFACKHEFKVDLEY